jgi:hypothetical protein
MAGKFEPKVPVQLDPPKDDPISVEELAKANGTSFMASAYSCLRPRPTVLLISLVAQVKTEESAMSPSR